LRPDLVLSNKTSFFQNIYNQSLNINNVHVALCLWPSLSVTYFLNGPLFLCTTKKDGKWSFLPFFLSFYVSRFFLLTHTQSQKLLAFPLFSKLNFLKNNFLLEEEKHRARIANPFKHSFIARKCYWSCFCNYIIDHDY